MLRAILMVIFLLLVGVFSIVLIPLALLIGLFDKDAKLRYSFVMIRFYFRSFRFLSGADITYTGLEYLPKKGDDAVVFIGNHRSIFDIIFLYSVLNTPTGLIAKKEMETWPIISWWMGFIHCLFLDRKNQLEGVKTIIRGINYVKEGTSMVIYPEGTRSKEDGVLLPFHAGSFKLATKPGAKLIPVAVNNTSQVFEDHVPIVKKAVVSMEFCPPIDTSALTPEETKKLPDTVYNIILEKIQTNGKRIGTVQD